MSGHTGLDLPDREPVLRPTEVAVLLGVDPDTVVRWAKQGRIAHVRTLGGHRRFPASEVLRLMRDCRIPEAERALAHLLHQRDQLPGRRPGR